MPRGHAPKRETKKQKKKAKEAPVITSPIVAASDVEVIRKKRKRPREE